MPIDFDIPPESKTVVRFSAVAELIYASTLASGRPSHISGFDVEWQRRQRAELPESSRLFLAKTQGYSCPVLSLIDFIALSRELDDFDAFVAFVNELPIGEFIFYILNADIPRAAVEAGLRDPSSAAAHTLRLSYFSRMEARDLVALFTDPQSFRQELIDYVASNRTRLFEARVRELQPLYAERCGQIGARLAGRAPLDVASELKKRPFQDRGYRYFFFVPSYFIGRMNLTSTIEDAFLFSFNIDPASTDAHGSAEELAGRLRVLSDRSRLEILRILASRASYGKEIASKLALTTATVSRHLDQLKTAGLVVEDQPNSQNMKLARVDGHAIETLLDELRQFIDSSQPPPPY